MGKGGLHIKRPKDGVVKQVKEKLLKDLKLNLINDLNSLQKLEDFTDDDAYNFILSIIQFKVGNGEDLESVYRDLHLLVDEAANDFLEQASE